MTGDETHTCSPELRIMYMYYVLWNAAPALSQPDTLAQIAVEAILA